jgi:nucleotide-binding universal stress UspA family protein
VTRVLIAVDETEASVHAAELAHQLFGDEADYSAVSVADVALDPGTVPWFGSAWGATYPVPYGAVWPLPGMVRSEDPSEPRPLDDGRDEPADTAMRAAADTARDVVEQSGLTSAEPVGELGDPADAILRAAEERDADVIVVGSHDRGWFDRLLNGSVEDDLLKRSDIPILVARP